jgi:hypothetical protein
VEFRWRLYTEHGSAESEQWRHIQRLRPRLSCADGRTQRRKTYQVPNPEINPALLNRSGSSTSTTRAAPPTGLVNRMLT